MSEPQKYDVHMKVGLAFIAGCCLIGFLIGALVPLAADTWGLIHLKGGTTALRHIGMRETFVNGAVCGLLGGFNGILLSIDASYSRIGLLAGLLPCGIYGTLLAKVTPPPYAGSANLIVFVAVPILIAGAIFLLRRAVWKRYQRPVRGSSKD